MALPKQVQQQVEALAEYDKRRAEEQAPANAEVDPPTEAATQAAPTATVSVLPSPTPASPEPQPQAQPADQWEQRYRTLQGMFAQETRNLHTQVNDLRNQLASVSAQQTATKPQPAQAAASEVLVTEKDTEAFGSDLIDMARRVAREEFGSREVQYVNRIAALETQVKQQVGEVQQTQEQTSRESFFSKLEAAVPNWEQIQATPQCQQWLASRMPGTAFTWNDVLVDAASQFDSGRAMEVFRTFLAMHGPALATPAPAAPAAAPRPARNDLSRQVSPPRAASTASIPSDTKRVYTAAEYEAESMKVVRLNKQGLYADAVQIENELNAALMEGRLRP